MYALGLHGEHLVLSSFCLKHYAFFTRGDLWWINLDF